MEIYIYSRYERHRTRQGSPHRLTFADTLVAGVFIPLAKADDWTKLFLVSINLQDLPRSPYQYIL